MTLPARPSLQRRGFIAGAAALASGCAAVGSGPSSSPAAGAEVASPAASAVTAPGLPAHELPPAAPREFRAAWVATVVNIDWPSRPGLPSDVQQAQALLLLDRAREVGLNAIVLQVRTSGDALYASALEPWSEYLSDTQGRAPQPAYDPLSFWVEQAHRRGLELHAWFNPYRARHSAAKSALVAPHLARTRPDAVKVYGDQQWMDPGEGAAAERTLAVVADVVRRYDIDGVHIDDYFYPYPVQKDGVDQPFPDDPAWLRYLQGGGTLVRDDWRRDNVNRLVQRLYRSVHELKPWVRFGISPFGLGRPDRRPPGIEGFSQFDKLYADVELWLSEGWLDYLVPQLYWPIDRAAQSFAVLLDYWLAQNPRGRPVWPGLYTSRIGAPQNSWGAAEIGEQITLSRRRLSTAGGALTAGHVHFSMVALMQDREGIATSLKAGAYAQPALAPASTWLDDQPPPVPTLRLDGRRWVAEPGRGKPVFVWAIWRRQAGQWRFAVQPGHDRFIDPGTDCDAIVLSALCRVGNESVRVARRLGST